MEAAARGLEPLKVPKGSFESLQKSLLGLHGGSIKNTSFLWCHPPVRHSESKDVCWAMKEDCCCHSILQRQKVMGVLFLRETTNTCSAD